ncbi:high affinity cAMP-specific and IBMX-insensitive 3',5'-cyclic phosphodiesterase 8-like isoform X2 [Bacillus rossius redtenbacheri]|uniref:high affinity cAMP-specific and IBMX-insensitive 3',5'-cyclic phosphodiesterase 8-like isoform X2 n=1 Tax=Bacillus rossius redtenbacheri TaxID=93214 RepID=UPI002FDCA713
MGCAPSILPGRGPRGGDEAPRCNSTVSGGGSRTWRFGRSAKSASTNNKAASNSKATGVQPPGHRPVRPASAASAAPAADVDGHPAAAETCGTRVVLVFPKDDAQLDALWLAGERLGLALQVARSAEAAADCLAARRGALLVLVDCRQPRLLDPEAVCRAARLAGPASRALLVAVVRRSLVEKDESVAQNFLAAGFNRVMAETTSAALCANELLLLDRCDLAPRVQASLANQAMALALARSGDLVHITDSAHRIQHVSKLAEQCLGYASQSLVGRHLLELCVSEGLDAMQLELEKGREWEGLLSWRCRTGDTLSLSTRVYPVALPGRTPAQYVYIHEPPAGMENRNSQTSSHQQAIMHRGSLNSVRKGSTDIRSISSDGTRRQSLAKIHSLSLQAPITKVIELISSVQEDATEQVALVLDKVLEILRTTEQLYGPATMRERNLKTQDPVTSDLISALLTQGGTPGNVSTTRRSSSESSNIRMSLKQQPTSKASKLLPLSAKAKDLLDRSLDWEFDIFRLEKLTEFRPLVHLGMSLFLHFDSHFALGCDETTLKNWLTLVEYNYRRRNSYHNSTHAADVMQCAACFLDAGKLRAVLDPLDRAICLVSAAAHDIDHPGKSSAFLCNSDHELACLYNDISVLESHHAALTFKLTVSDPRVNIFQGLERDTYKVVRQNVIDMILATEMTRHFEHLTKFVSVFSRPGSKDEELSILEASEAIDPFHTYSLEQLSLVKRMLIKCADVSNPTRPVHNCVEWALRIAEEYFTQTDEEKANNLPVVMPLFDRATCSIPKSQIGFMDFIIREMFEAWEEFIEMPKLLEYMEKNYTFWKDLETRGIVSSRDIERDRKDRLRSMAAST